MNGSSDESVQYVPIQTFEEFWTGSGIDLGELGPFLGQLNELRAGGHENRFGDVVTRWGREAAAETGAVEDLYDLDPGNSWSIANADPGWEGLLQRKGSDGLK